MTDVSVFQPVGAHAIATQAAIAWCEERAGITPGIASEFASYYAHHMTERTTNVWEWDDPTDTWAEWVDELRGYGVE